MKIRKIVVLCLSLVVLLQAAVFPASAGSNGSAYIFTFTWSDANTRPAGKTEVLRHLWNMGYGADEYLNNGAPPAYSVFPNSQIFVVVTHGLPGRIRLGKEDNMSYIYANNSVSGDNRSVSNLSSGSLSGVRLVLYVACESGLTSTSWGNLVTTTSAKGAQCVVGWNKKIKCNQSCDWVRLLFEKADQEHDVLWECFNHADYWTKDIWGDVGELNNRNEAGNITQYLYK